MAKFNLRKRNKVIRKYCPQFLEKEPPEDKGKLLAEGKVPIDALIMHFDETDELTDVWAVKQPFLVQRVFSNDDEFKDTMRMTRERYLETDTIVFDVAAISRVAGQDMLKYIFAACYDRPYRFRGMTQQELAHVLLNPADLRPEQPASSNVDTLSLEEFFDGNQSDSSIAPNIADYGHPGIDVFRETLLHVRDHTAVLDVRIGVNEWPYPDETDMWIAAENVYIWCNGISIDDIKQWLAPLKPDTVASVAPSLILKHGPETNEHTQVVAAVWD